MGGKVDPIHRTYYFRHFQVEENENATYAEMYKLEKSQAWANMLAGVRNRQSASAFQNSVLAMFTKVIVSEVELI